MLKEKIKENLKKIKKNLKKKKAKTKEKKEKRKELIYRIASSSNNNEIEALTNELYDIEYTLAPKKGSVLTIFPVIRRQEEIIEKNVIQRDEKGNIIMKDQEVKKIDPTTKKIITVIEKKPVLKKEKVIIEKNITPEFITQNYFKEVVVENQPKWDDSINDFIVEVKADRFKINTKYK